MKTNLFIAGACKSGTSFLHEFLGLQNEICASNPKEPYFFELTRDKRDENAYYAKYFEHYNSEKYLLDGRHRNMFFSWIPQEIFDFNRNSKIVFILRDPVERAYSHWWMWYARNIIKTNFHKTINRELKRISEKGLQMNFLPTDYSLYIKNNVHLARLAYADANTIVESGYYYTQIRRFKDLFEDDQLLIIDYEEIKNPKILLRKLEVFLEIDFQTTQKKKRINKALEYAKPKYSLGVFLPKRIKDYFKKKLLVKKQIPQKTKLLLKQHYMEENQKLYMELGVKFAKNWI